MTGLANRALEADRREQQGPPPRFGLSPFAALFAAVVLAIPIFAHGCHVGDHDDEPLFAPHTHDAEPPR